MRIFITGSSDGIGLLAAQMLAEAGHQVTLHARNADRAKSTKAAVPKAEHVLIADLRSIAEIKQLAEDANATGRFDTIIHNAGIGYGRTSSREITADGVSAVFAVNTLAPYILTCLMDKPKARMMYMSSDSHWGGDASLKDCTQSHSYSNSKLHDVMLANAFARRWKDVQVVSMHPGWVRTKMGGEYQTVALTRTACLRAQWLIHTHRCRAGQSEYTSQSSAAMVSRRWAPGEARKRSVLYH